MNILRAICRFIMASGIVLLPIASSAQGTGYWHTSGNQILDANNQQVRIAGINWYGFETTDAVAHGLQTADYKAVLTNIHSLGYNTLRIPLSNQMVETPTASSSLNISYYRGFGPINGDLQGLNSMQVLDKIILYADTVGLKVILDNHRSEAGNSAESNGLWYTSAYPEQAWINDWTALAARYAGNSTVIGFDLRNEPHNANSGGACWDCGSSTNDWHLAAQRAGNAVLGVNPNLLIFVEGTDAYHNDYYWWGGNLEGVANSPVTLAIANRLVYSAHDYGPTEYGQSWFNNDTAASLAAVWKQHWAYIAQAAIAPVWLGEFGTTNTTTDLQNSASGSEGFWFQTLIAYLHADSTLNWTYWAMNGEDNYGLLDSNYDPTPVNPAKQNALASNQFALKIANASATLPTTPTGLMATVSSASQISLNWTASTTSGVTYNVQYGTSASSITTAVASGLTATTFPATGLNPSTTYYFTVSATSSGGTSAASTPAFATTQSAPAPAAPSGLVATAASSREIDLSWASSSASGVTYTVYGGTSPNPAGISASGLTSANYAATNLSASKTYYYVVKAFSNSVASAASNGASATTQADPVTAAPASLTATATSSSQINLSWTASATPGATYTVYSGTSAGSIASVLGSGLSSTSFSTTNLTASTAYYFSVVATSMSVSSAKSNIVSATTQPAAVNVPHAPGSLSASPTSSSQINLSWVQSQNQPQIANITYSIFQGTSASSISALVASGITGTNYSLMGLADGTTYYFTVKAVANSATSAASNIASATTQTAPSTPPTGVTATAISATEIDLTWTQVANTGTTYSVYSGFSSGATNTLLVSGLSGAAYAVTGLSASTTYYFTMRSVSVGGSSSPSTQASASTLAAGTTATPPQPSQPAHPTAPTAPSGLAASASSASQVNLTWTASTAQNSTSAITYTLYTGSSAGSINAVLAANVYGTSYTVSNLPSGSTTYYALTASNATGTSAASNVASATTQAAAPSAPTNLSATAISDTQIGLSWTASAGSNITYSVFNGGSQVATNVSATSYQVNGLTASTAYSFTVRAVSSGGTSPASNLASATTQAMQSGACHVTYIDQNDWGAGMTGAIAITNNGRAIASWTLTWAYSGTQQIYQSWSSNYAESAGKVTLTNAAWNGAIGAGGTVSGIGFNANYSGVNTNPVAFYLNGQLCQ